MPAFVKSPRFIIGAIVVLWVVYVLWANFQLDPVKVHVIPLAATLDFRVSAVIIGSAIFGVIITLVVQWLWRRRSSKNASQSAADSAASARTVA
jgi:heme/copper-type cytochrome/quinol oxidase subunit 2